MWDPSDFSWQRMENKTILVIILTNIFPSDYGETEGREITSYHPLVSVMT